MATKTKRTKGWILEAWAKAIKAGSMTIDQINDVDRPRVERLVSQMSKPVDPRKSIAQDLDTAAQRATIISRTPASQKQCWYLAGLLHARGLTANDVECGALNTQAVLCSGRASRMIDEFTKQ